MENPVLDRTGNTFVLSGTQQQAYDFGITYGIDPRRVIQVNSTDKLRGIDGTGRILWLYGTFADRLDFHKLTMEAKVRGFKIVSEKHLARYYEIIRNKQGAADESRL